jgi:tRNA-dihydrouridine synthase B
MKSIKIGPHSLKNRAVLAPMSGVSDLPFRRLAARFGAGMVVSEMVASESFVKGDAETQMRAEAQDGGCMSFNWPAGKRAGWAKRPKSSQVWAPISSISIWDVPRKR